MKKYKCKYCNKMVSSYSNSQVEKQCCDNPKCGFAMQEEERGKEE